MASNSMFSVSWDSYQRNVCSGFSAFQQNHEFVDMTIAADKYIVKVHKALVALASPYLKEIIQSTPANQHPIIFLNNVDYSTLCHLLEYIYTGEVLVPIEELSKFLEMGKSLNIRGLENVVDTQPKRLSTPASNQKEDLIKGLKPVVVKSTRSTKEITIPATAKKVFSVRVPTSQPDTSILTSTDIEEDVSYEMDTTYEAASDFDDTQTDFNPPTQLTQTPTKKARREIESNIQFTVSTRGSIQMILNRYLYNATFTSQTRNTRRWRCVDYRDSRCPAFVVTKGSTVIKRYHPHNHGFHDKKIIGKLEKNAVYSAIEDIEDNTNNTEKEAPTEYN